MEEHQLIDLRTAADRLLSRRPCPKVVGLKWEHAAFLGLRPMTLSLEALDEGKLADQQVVWVRFGEHVAALKRIFEEQKIEYVSPSG